MYGGPPFMWGELSPFLTKGLAMHYLLSASQCSLHCAVLGPVADMSTTTASPLAKICLHQLIINQDNMEHWQAATPDIGGTLEDWKLVCLVDYSSPHIKQTNRVYKLWRCPILYSPPWSWSCTKVEKTIRENHQSCPGKTQTEEMLLLHLQQRPDRGS